MLQCIALPYTKKIQKQQIVKQYSTKFKNNIWDSLSKISFLNIILLMRKYIYSYGTQKGSLVQAQGESWDSLFFPSGGTAGIFT